MIYTDDAIKWLRRHEKEWVDLIVTSPPYGTIRDYDGDYPFYCADLAIELARCLKPNGVLVWIRRDQFNKGSQSGESWQQAQCFMNQGLRLHDTMIYAKNNPLPVGSARRYNQHWEYMFVFSKGAPKTFNPIQAPAIYSGIANVRNRGQDNKGTYKKVVRKPTKKIGNIWYYTLGKGHMGFSKEDDKLLHQHPAVFPLKLAQDQIKTWTSEREIVLDPMCGSGQTCIAARMLNRDFVGVDISKKYTNLANRRLELLNETPSDHRRY